MNQRATRFLQEPGERRFARLDAGGAGFTFEGGGHLDVVDVAYETWGTLNEARDNAVLVLHALTGDSHCVGVAGPGHPTPGWWNEVVGPHRAVDTTKYFVVCPNVLGGCRGTTGPSSLDEDGRPYGARFPAITIRDQVAVEVALADALGVTRFAAVVGGSMGAMRALEWLIGYRERVASAALLAVGAAASADQIALCSLQVRAIRNDPNFRGGDYYDDDPPREGLALARGIGQFSYRTWTEFEDRFGRRLQDQPEDLERRRYAIESYLEYHGDKLAARFDANSYVVLSEAMNHHDVGRGRGGVAAALGSISVPVRVAGVTSDRLYPFALQEELARLIPTCDVATPLHSPAGHDGFLIEHEQVAAVIAAALASNV